MPTASPLTPPISMRDADLVDGDAEVRVERRIGEQRHDRARADRAERGHDVAEQQSRRGDASQIASTATMIAMRSAA